MSTRFGFVCFGVAAVFLGVGSAFLPVARADCPTLFGAHVLYGAGNGPSSVAIGDLDGDGDADLVVANSSDDNVSVLLNNGDGTFAAHVLYGVGNGPSSVAIGDLDGDGDADLAVVNAGSATSPYC
ncbi:MAG: VCBS repeat-containing protein [Planctomycetes bacterium]|nr:VCBS repeat-containing protein [Planctomycetota bacterium]